MWNYVVMYAKIGLGVGSVVFCGNLISVCIPGNKYVDPVYVWENLTRTKFVECCVISTTKGIIAGLTWPLICIRTVKDMIFSPETAGTYMCLGFHKSLKMNTN